MKSLLTGIVASLIILLASCGKTDVAPESKEIAPLNIEQMIGLINQPFSSIQDTFANRDIIITDSLGQKKVSLALLDKEAPNPNFVCEILEEKGVVKKIFIKATKGSHGTFKNTFFYFDQLLSAKYPLLNFYAVDADGGVNNSNKSKDDLHLYLNYSTSSGAAEQFETQATTILNFFFNEADKAFVIFIEKK